MNTVAGEIAGQVDRLLGVPWDRTAQRKGRLPRQRTKNRRPPSCASGASVRVLEIDGRKVEVLALPPILEMFCQAAKPPTRDGRGDTQTVRLYNQVPEGAEASWKLALGRAYASYSAEGR